MCSKNKLEPSHTIEGKVQAVIQKRSTLTMGTAIPSCSSVVPP